MRGRTKSKIQILHFYGCKEKGVYSKESCKDHKEEGKAITRILSFEKQKSPSRDFFVSCFIL
jgi:hypothetical protein